jgi:putative hydrolase of the HAD superfamily
VTAASARLRAVIFDWGETLVALPGLLTDREGHFACVRAAFEDVAENDAAPEIGRAALTWSSFRPSYESAAVDLVGETRRTLREHGFAERFALAFARAGCPLSDEGAASVTKRFTDLVVERSVAMPGAVEIVARLAPRYKLGVVSNYSSAAAVRDSLARLGLLPHLTAVVVSHDVGWVKPHRALFDRALAQLGVGPDEAVYIGDNYDHDVVGARAAGVRPIWFAPEGGGRDDVHVLRSLADLEDALDNG